MHWPRAADWLAHLTQACTVSRLCMHRSVGCTVQLASPKFALEAGHEGTSCDPQTQVSTFVRQGPAGSANLGVLYRWSPRRPHIRFRPGTAAGCAPRKKRFAASRIAFTASRLAYCQALPRSPIPSDRRGPVGWQPVSELVSSLLTLHIQIAPIRGSRGMGPSTLLGLGPRADGVWLHV